jgi:hypothetical protein
MPYSDLKLQQQGFADQLCARQISTVDDSLFQEAGEQLSRRMAVYRGNMIANQSKALQGAYPVVAKIVGADFFAGLAREYGRQVPSVSGDLNEFGESLPEFLAQFPPARDLPYLPDVAQLEWRVHCAFYAADHKALEAARLALVPADKQSSLRFQLHPACAMMRSDYPLARIWEIHQDDYDGEFEIGDNPARGWVLVSRPALRVRVSELSEADAAFLERVQGPLEEALAGAQAIDAAFNLGDRLMAWIEGNVIVDFNF